MKLTVEKLTQIIREEIENATEAFNYGSDGKPSRAQQRFRSRERNAGVAASERRAAALAAKRPRPRVSEKTYKKIIDAVSELPGSPGEPKKSDKQSGLDALRDFFRENEDFYKDLIRQANLAWMDSKPEDKITDALHAAGGLFSKLDVPLVLQILDGVNPAPAKEPSLTETAADIMKALEAHGWDQKEFSAISGGAYGDDLTPEERARLDNKYDELVKKDAVKALLKQYAQARKAKRKGK